MQQSTFTVGSLVKVRGREWIVLPDSNENWLSLRPIGGSEEENTMVYIPLERVESASFALPDISKPGDNAGAGLLREAIRLGFRSSAGPFRSAAHLSFEPRPYQLVPLLLALRKDTVRILIADDVGIGKTVESGLIVRELLDRGEISRLAVLCPPPLAEQWQAELRDKFHIEAELVLSSTIAKLERNISPGKSVFETYPYVIVSLDYIKGDRRRDEFIRTCPECVIVDEAHTCASSQGKAAQQRHALLQSLAKDPKRHLILVTATPHSGKEDAFRSLISILNPEFEELPDDLTKTESQEMRRKLSAYLVQRRRGDIRSYMKEETPFPKREENELSYALSKEYAALFRKVIEYVREIVKDSGEGTFRQRVRWWSALALLRSIASSPAAAAETLRNRALTADTEKEEEIDRIGRQTILDYSDGDTLETMDTPLGAEFEDENVLTDSRLRRMAKEADELYGKKDQKLQTIIPQVKKLLNEGYNPILFCRFIPTAEYVAEELKAALPKDVNVISVTGTLPPAERVDRVESLRESPRRVLVATDCLSEGINLQELFNAVIHYDLSWNPTRHEQREGRVDRYGQPADTIRVLTYFGKDNQIDGIILNVLLRKHKQIRNSLGVSVPIPGNAEQVVDAILEGLLLNKGNVDTAKQDFLPGLEPAEKKAMLREWDNATAREKRSRTIFAQETIHPDEVAAELSEVRNAIGSGVELPEFCANALTMNNARIRKPEVNTLEADLSQLPVRLKDSLNYAMGQGNLKNNMTFRFELPLQQGQRLLTRTHPFVEALANYVLETSLDEQNRDDPYARYARRCGVVKTDAVSTRTTLLLLRFRYHIVDSRTGKPMLAEECIPMAFEGRPGKETWLNENAAEKLLKVIPTGNLMSEQIQKALTIVAEGTEALQPKLIEIADERAAMLQESHNRVRRGRKATVTPQLPADILGFYVYLP